MGRKPNQGSVPAERARASGAGTDRRDDSRGRFSAQRKAQAVLRVLRDEDLVQHIRRVLQESPFHGEGYRKVWANLRCQQIRTAPERVRRLMREHGLQAPQRAGHAHGPKAHEGTIVTPRPDMMWGTDITTTARPTSPTTSSENWPSSA